MAAARRFVKDEATAKDVLQESLIRIFKNIGKYEHSGSFEAWMRKITVRCALTSLRKSKIKSEIELSEQHYSKTVEPIVFGEMGLKEIQRLIETLPIGYRTVFNLNVIEGFTHREIAHDLDITESASRSQLSRAKKMLQEKIYSLEQTIRNSA